MVDYRTFKEADDKAPPPDKEKDVVQVQWWKAGSDKALAEAVFGQVNAITKADTERTMSYAQNTRLYGNQSNPIKGNGLSVSTLNSKNKTPNERLGFNLIQSCVDTLTSKIVKNKPKPFFLTSKGDSKLQRKAKKLNDFSDGVFYENKAYAWMMPRCFRDGCIFGEGIIHVFAENGRIKWERVMPYEVLVDYLEAHSGPEHAMTMHRIKTVDRSVLMAWAPEKAAEIAAIPATSKILSGIDRSVSDVVTVVESWRLPSKPGEKDGMHCVTVPGVVLFRDDEFDKPNFPFAFFRYSPRTHGFWAQGLSEQLTPIQIELNRCLMTVQRSFYLGATFKWLLHVSSNVVSSHIDNSIGPQIKWAGEHPPQVIVPPLVQPEIYQQIATLKQMGYEQSGISQLSAASNKPAGLDSGKALREAVDIETDRFQVVGQAYEQLALDLAMLSIDVAKDIYADKEELTVKVPGKRFIKTVDWGEIDMDADEYSLQCFPVSKLPSTPEGRLQSIQEMMQAGLIDPEAGRRLLDYPDLDAEEELANSQLDYLHDILDAMVEDGKYTQPEPFDNMQAARKLALEYYAIGKRDNLEEDKLNLLRQFIQDLTDLATGPTPAGPPPPPGAAAGAPAGPQAAPMAPPTSDLLPNAPSAA